MTQSDAWWWAFLGVLLVAVFAHVLLPRYDWKEVRDPNAVSVLVYDKWTGRMQRAIYDDKGQLSVLNVYVPF